MFLNSDNLSSWCIMLFSCVMPHECEHALFDWCFDLLMTYFQVGAPTPHLALLLPTLLVCALQILEAGGSTNCLKHANHCFNAHWMCMLKSLMFDHITLWTNTLVSLPDLDVFRGGGSTLRCNCDEHSLPWCKVFIYCVNWWQFLWWVRLAIVTKCVYKRYVRYIYYITWGHTVTGIDTVTQSTKPNYSIFIPRLFHDHYGSVYTVQVSRIYVSTCISEGSISLLSEQAQCLYLHLFSVYNPTKFPIIWWMDGLQ